ncbi:hypothetical protein RI129_001263 [Pyrocoelia pectoralis]|uniref:CCHC-type domain-containing protein n=1 Tax=Pyrocoelia pectoralis TaxID=417401 RepID=A0AAN7VV36_9COLE
MKKAARKLLDTKLHMVKIYASPSNRDYIRKMAECLFYNKGIKYCIEGSTPNTEGATMGKRNTTESVTITLNNEGKTYADLLKGVRKALTGTEKEALKASYKTKDGGLKLVLDQKKGNLSALTQKLNTELGEGAKCKVAEDQEIYFIRDLDEIATKEEISQAMQEALGTSRAADVETSEIRVAQSGQRSATIAVAKTQAGKMVELPTIWIATTRCRIQKKVEINRCPQCWGTHNRREKCEERDMKDRCLKCGEVGHFKQQCQSSVTKCAVCDVEGHATWTMACPQYKAAIRAAERGRRPIRLVNSNAQ